MLLFSQKASKKQINKFIEIAEMLDIATMSSTTPVYVDGRCERVRA
jgi:hypothetical protein